MYFQEWIIGIEGGSGLTKITDETGRLFKDECYHVEYYNNNGFLW